MTDSKANSYTLIYFNGRGRAEITRILFKEAGVNFVDKRVEGKDWPAYKPQTPFGQMPVLEVNGKQIAESGAIERYVARVTNAYGASAWESAQVDQTCEALHDTFGPLMATFGIKDAEEKKTKTAAFFADHYPGWTAKLEKLLESNNGGNGYFVGTGVTLADIHFFVAYDNVLRQNAAGLDRFPKLKALHARVGARPNIAAWIRARPDTPF